MDPFTQKMLLKAEQRSKTLATKCDGPPLGFDPAANAMPLREFNQFAPNGKKPIVTKTVKKNFSENENDDFNVEINITTTPNIEVEVQVVEKDAADVENQAPAALRDNSRNRLHRLGALYSATQDLSSPISRTEHKFCAQPESVDMNPPPPRREKEKSGKLVALAATIREWEDDEIGVGGGKKLDNPPPKPPHVVRQVAKEKPQQQQQQPTSKTIDLKWDSKVINSLEAQGFQRKKSLNTKVHYNFGKESEKEKPPTTSKVQFKSVSNSDREVKSGFNKDTTTNCTKSNLVSISNKDSVSKPTLNSISSNSKDTVATKSTTANCIKPNLVSSKIKAFESDAVDVGKKPKKDPTELSLKERMQLFEKNKGPALVPRNHYGAPAPIPIKKLITPNSTVVTAPIDKTFRGKVFANETNTKTISEANIISEIQKQKLADMEVIASRFKRNEQQQAIPTPPPPPPQPQQPVVSSSQPSTPKSSVTGNIKKRPSTDNSSNTEEDNTTDDSKRAKIVDTNPQTQRLYPTLSKFEFANDSVTTTPSSSFSSYRNHGEDSFMDEESTDECFEEKKLLQQNDRYSSSDRKLYCADSSITSDNSGGLTDYLDEALEDDIESETQSRANSPVPVRQETKPIPAVQQSVQASTSTNNDESKTITLVHTVSFYRRQQGTKQTDSSDTPTKKIIRNQKILEVEDEETENESGPPLERQVRFEDEDACSEAMLVQEKIQKLLNEVCKQQTIIGQTSQALNLCASTIEFSGSTESVEGERHLLVATHRRQAALDEIQRLRVEGQIRPSGTPKEKGRLTVKEITIPLRSEYIRKLSNDTISGHHLVCLLKYNDTVLATKTVPTLPGLLTVKFPDVLQLDQVHADFRVTLEIYGMTAQREVLPHEVKYHIDISKKTPKRRNKDSRLISPMPHSPAVNIIRTPAFVQYGFAIFSLREIQRNSWTLNRVAGVSPLEGTVNMKLDCELQVSIDYKGFLTMFEEISGFGAWHRRWCRLNGHILNYWKYPDDEKRKAPIGSIDLSACCSQKIQTAPRDICARLNTFLVECSRQPEDNDFESLVIVPKGHVTIVRSLLSADTKEERDEWCAYLNKSFTLLRAWSPRN